jgi:hypothetical protein
MKQISSGASVKSVSITLAVSGRLLSARFIGLPADTLAFS